MVIYPESFSVKPNTEATVGFRNLFNTTSQSAVHKNLTLLKGKYVFQSKNAAEYEVHITNTIGEKEYADKSRKNIRKTAIVIDSIKDMEIDCCDSDFIMDGKMSHIHIKNCEKLKIKNLNIKSVFPNVHKITILKASTFYITFEIDETSKVVEENGEYYWVGTDYKFGFTEYKNGGGWMPTACEDNLFHIKRNGRHPFYGVSSIKRVSDRVFNARFIVPKDYEVGQIFYMYPTIREDVGILIENSKNITLENISQDFNYSLALVAQNSENITLDKLDFSPPENFPVDFCSFADFLQFSMCRGKISVTNCNFDSAGDDVCNVHGFNFKIIESNKDRMTVKFCHPQSYGFDCIRDGDIIAFIDPVTLTEVGRTKVLHATLRDEYYYDLILTTYDPPIGVGGAIECIPANPDFYFVNNTINRIVTRGVLATTRGKIRIENNKFLNTGGAGVLIANDASDWYESGPVQDVVISGNAFMNCEDSAVLVKPEIKKYAGAVHRNVVIENNLFVLNNIYALDATATDGIIMRGNMYKGRAKNGKWINTKLCNNVTDDCPK